MKSKSLSSKKKGPIPYNNSSVDFCGVIDDDTYYEPNTDPTSNWGTNPIPPIAENSSMAMDPLSSKEPSWTKQAILMHAQD